MNGNDEDLRAKVAELEAQLEKEKAKSRKAIRLEVSQKGGVSLYGIRRFPITFYLEEWNTILGMADQIRTFLAEHEGELAKKG